MAMLPQVDLEYLMYCNVGGNDNDERNSGKDGDDDFDTLGYTLYTLIHFNTL